MPLGHAVFFKKHFGTSSVISDQASMCSRVSVFCSHHFSVKHLKVTSFCDNILIPALFRVLNLVKLTFWTAISSHQAMGMRLIKVWVMEIYHTEYGPFLATDVLKTKGSGRVMGKNCATTSLAKCLFFKSNLMIELSY